jgi:predicted secreted protein
MRRLTPAALCLGLVAALPALAGPQERLPEYDRASFSVTATAEVENDTLVAVLAVQRDGSSTRRLSAEVNQAMTWALGKAREVAAVKAQTLDYQTSPLYQKGTITGWRVSQSLRLESRDAAALSELIGALQEQLTLQSVGYEVSRERRRQIEEKLVTEGIAGFQARARLVADGMKRQGYRLVQMDVGTNDQPVPIVPRAMRMAAAEMQAAPPPAFEAGTQTLSVTVSGTVELTPD